MPRARLADVALPDFGMPSSEPLLPASIHAQRLERLRERMESARYDRLVVWGDREHSANLAYLTGFDPRFEDALLVVGPDGPPALLAGNECAGVAAAAPLPVRQIMFQDFSLPGQARDRSRSLAEILGDEGVGAGSRVGLIGWKTYGSPTASDVPSYVVDEVRRLAGSSELVVNATGILTDAADGLRVINEADQLAAFEWAACQTSSGVRSLITELRPGMTEHEAVQLLRWPGTPLSCHLMLTAGERARFGLLSPSDRRIARGDPFTTAFGIWGALNCRAGFVVEDAGELPAPLADAATGYLARLVVPYFTAVAEWYAALHVGQRGGVLQEIVDRHLGDPFFGVGLNPGHQLHLDEWVNSPVFRDSTIELRSGMALQCDIIPATGTEWFTTNIEDGVALADESLRDELSTRYPDAWGRIGARRTFMRESLGIDLHPDVLPLSNLAAHLTPYLLAPDRALTMVD